jgi:uncharacterized protein (TIGR00369 family)
VLDFRETAPAGIDAAAFEKRPFDREAWGKWAGVPGEVAGLYGHGGVLATLIDAAAGFAGCYCSVPGNVRRALSLSVTTNFTGQAQAGVIRVVARKRAGGRTIYFASVEVFNDQDELIALGEATYRYRKGSENLEGVPAPAD